jgi:BirA family biotin operon repressor/biotin-[acetyl-CoA-carboxylase] ligase
VTDDHLSIDRLAEGLGTAQVIGAGRIELHRRIGSTNDRIRELARAGTAAGAVAAAETQTGGRGRRGRTWHSPAGAGLYFSVLLRPTIPPDMLPLITIAAGVGAAEAVESLAGRTPDLKWPNDLLMDGLKIGGILTEIEFNGDAPDFVVVGLGINVNLDVADLEPELVGAAGSLSMALGRPLDRTSLLIALLGGLERAWLDLCAGRRDALLERYRRKCFLIGERVTARIGERTVEGWAEDVDRWGRLMLRSSERDALIPLSGGEVFQVRPAGPGNKDASPR